MARAFHATRQWRHSPGAGWPPCSGSGVRPFAALRCEAAENARHFEALAASGESGRRAVELWIESDRLGCEADVAARPVGACDTCGRRDGGEVAVEEREMTRWMGSSPTAATAGVGRLWRVRPTEPVHVG